MTEINPKINSTQAGQIAKQLDKKDGYEDGKISASIWNEFVADKGGKEIKYSITLENAMKSISTYLYKNANKAGQTVKDLAESWLKKEVEANKTANPTPVKDANGTTPTKPIQRPENAPPLKVEYPPVPPKGPDMREVDYIELNSMQGKWVQGHKADGKNAADFIRPFLEGKGLDANYLHGDANACIAKLNKDNVAYVIQNLGDLLFKSENGEALFNDLINNLKTKAKELGIVIPNNMDKEGIKQLTQAIIEKNESAINEMNAMQSIKTPNPELAGKTIEDKATGYKYDYDENGVIEEISKDGASLFYKCDGGAIDRRNNPEYAFSDNGNVTVYTTYDDNGENDVARWADGNIYYFTLNSIDHSNDYYVDEETGKIYASSETQYSDEDGIDEVYRDKDGNLEYYREHCGDKFLYKKPDGTTYKSYDISFAPTKFYDANGNEISKEEWDKLQP